MARPVPIPPDLWHRLAALDARCDFSMVRRDANAPAHRHTSMKNFQREWEVRVRARDDARGPIIAQHAALRPALEAAVDMAERNGWHAPAQVPAPRPPDTGVAKIDG